MSDETHKEKSERKDFVVIGAGCGRTGTASLKLALEILLNKPCYHMLEVLQNGDADFWCQVAEGKRRDYDTVLRPYGAAVDFPSAMFWEDQAKYYPEAKVILTVRSPDTWYKSASETIFNMLPAWKQPLGVRVVLNFPFGKLRKQGALGAHLQKFFKYGLSEEGATKQFVEWNEHVRKTCPRHRLLIFEVNQGWEPLCKFLNVPVPDVPFPKVNDTKEFKRRIQLMNVVGCGVLFGVSTLVALGASHFLGLRM